MVVLFTCLGAVTARLDRRCYFALSLIIQNISGTYCHKIQIKLITHAWDDDSILFRTPFVPKLYFAYLDRRANSQYVCMYVCMYVCSGGVFLCMYVEEVCHCVCMFARYVSDFRTYIHSDLPVSNVHAQRAEQPERGHAQASCLPMQV